MVAMAQCFTGTSNINLLMPLGQFGSRLSAGKDAASPRYIFTRLSPITPPLFKTEDSPLLIPQDDDGQPIEPRYYLPVLPMVLVNGACGIGTGFSTNVPQYSPEDIARNLERLMDGEEPLPMVPWYRGFVGIIEPGQGTNFVTRGVYSKHSEDTLEITELPVGRWTNDYKEFLEALLPESGTVPKRSKRLTIAGYENHSSEVKVCFRVTFPKGCLDAAMADEQFESDMHLTTTLTTTNMHLYTERQQIRKFADTTAILRHYYALRLDLYTARKAWLVKRLRRDLAVSSNKIRFLEGIMDDSIVVFRRSREHVIQMLQSQGFQRYCASPDLAREDPDSDGDYGYLTSMHIASFTTERIEALKRETEERQVQLDGVLKTPEKQMWRDDIREVLDKRTEIDRELLDGHAAVAVPGSKKKKAQPRRKAVVV